MLEASREEATEGEWDREGRVMEWGSEEEVSEAADEDNDNRLSVMCTLPPSQRCMGVVAAGSRGEGVAWNVVG